MELPVSDRLFRHAFSTPQSAREPLTPQLREFFQSCYREMAARKEAEEIAVLNTLR